MPGNPDMKKHKMFPANPLWVASQSQPKSNVEWVEEHKTNTRADKIVLTMGTKNDPRQWWGQTSNDETNLLRSIWTHTCGTCERQWWCTWANRCKPRKASSRTDNIAHSMNSWVATLQSKNQGRPATPQKHWQHCAKSTIVRSHCWKNDERRNNQSPTWTATQLLSQQWHWECLARWWVPV